MYRLSTALIATIAFLVGTSARADFIPWSYTWTADPQVSDGAGAGIGFFTTAAGTISTSKDVAGGVVLQAFAPDSSPGHVLNDAPYNVAMHITDKVSGIAGDFAFSGKLSGDINAGSVTNVFNAPETQSLTLGQNAYAVTIGSYVPPGSPSSNVWG
ncbi:MAG TPA: hypothetical protein VEL76_34085, partial [Gemmataceae bacterium]|nr:hypothetical protein [Gemmataceae bacterium]